MWRRRTSSLKSVVRVLLDENIDGLLKELFAEDIDVLTVRECGWDGKSNGELLRVAAPEFDALVTMDKNLEHQQDLGVLDLAVIVSRARSNAYPVVAPLMPEVNEAIRAARAGEVVHVTR